jgi:dihydropteroate synthase
MVFRISEKCRQSTRPVAHQLLTREQEAERADPQLMNTPLRVDTYRFEVAFAALDPGADMINDITGGFGFIETRMLISLPK